MSKGVVKLPKTKESSITQRFRKLLGKEHPDWKCVKLSILGQRDWPDYMVVGPNEICFIEFKRPGGEPTDRQTSCFIGYVSMVTEPRGLMMLEQPWIG